MIIVCIILAFIIVIWLIFKLLLPIIYFKKITKLLKKHLEKRCLPYELKRIKSAKYDIDLKTASFHYYLKILIIKRHAELQINNKTTWELRYGIKKTPNSAFTKRQILKKVVPFQSTTFPNDIQKIVIVYPNPKRIVKYINESEMIIVDEKTDIYGSKIITSDKFESLK